ncbi:MAG: hypothetical protein KAS72_04780 [Phycisphaerales bacterium]|nr:hypothetical protein [Phycisphaerales bacterium]
MKRRMVSICGLPVVAAILLATLCGQGFAVAQTEPSVRFDVLSVFVETGESPLAAWQLDLSATVGDVQIIGIEGGEHPAFREPPYYDPAAMQQERVIIASFSTLPGAELPTGRTRIATIHLMITGDTEPIFETHLDAAVTSDGSAIDVTVHTTLGMDS